MTELEMEMAFNEWLRRYTEEPEKFQHEWETIRTYLAEVGAGETPSYGTRCAAYLMKIGEELRNK